LLEIVLVNVETGRVLLMKRRMVSIITLTLLLTSMLRFGFQVQPVRAQTEGTIYIRGDGSIDPSTAPIQRNGYLYTLTSNITNYAANATIVVERNNIVVDGAGFAVEGKPGYRERGSIGISLNGTSNVTIQNMNFDNPYTGILLDSSFNNSINGNFMTRHDYGILLDSSFNNSINGNTMTESIDGIFLYSSSNNSIEKNTLTDTEGIRFNFSSNYNSIKRNNITNGHGGIRFDFSCDNNIIEENNIASSFMGINIYDSSENNSIHGNNITNNSLGGIEFDTTSINNSIYENTIENNTVGVVINTWSQMSLNAAYDTPLPNSSSNTFYHNNIITNTQQVSSSNLSGYANVWDGGYPLGGNYWSDYNGTDEDHDGIGDTAYVIDANNIDRYPLVTQYVVPEFSSFLIVPLFCIASLLARAIYRKKRSNEVT